MDTRDQTGILWTTLVVLLTSYLSCAGSAQTLKPLPTDADALHRTFQLRVAQYLTLHRRLEGTRPRTRLTEPIQMMFLSRAELASELRHARADARQGDIFAPDIAMVFRQTIETAVRDGLLGDVLAAVGERSGVRWVPAVNGDVAPEAVALPVCLQRTFPPLPPELEYRFLQRDLLLVDVRAGLIVDYVPTAIPSLTE